MALGLLVSEISHFCCKYFLYGQDIFDRTIISIIEHCHWCLYDIFSWQLSVLKTRPPCDFKLPDREMNVFRTGHFFVISSSLIWYINFCPVIIVIQTTGYFRYVITLEYPSLTHVSSYSNNDITKKQIIVAHSNKRQNTTDYAHKVSVSIPLNIKRSNFQVSQYNTCFGDIFGYLNLNCEKWLVQST